MFNYYFPKIVTEVLLSYNFRKMKIEFQKI